MKEFQETDNVEVLSPSECTTREQFDKATEARETELRNECRSGDNERLSDAVDYYAENYSSEELQSLRDELKDERNTLQEEYANSFLGDEAAQKSMPEHELNWENNIQSDECMAMAQERLKEEKSTEDDTKAGQSDVKFATFGLALEAVAMTTGMEANLMKIQSIVPPPIEQNSERNVVEQTIGSDFNVSIPDEKAKMAEKATMLEEFSQGLEDSVTKMLENKNLIDDSLSKDNNDDDDNVSH